MIKRNEFLARRPFDLFELQLVRLVADAGGFTQAGLRAGLTQSAVTRQVRGVEDRLGVSLFERTTRRVRLTPAGELFLREAHRIVGDVDDLTHQLTALANTPPTVRIGLARSIALAYYPGFLVASRRKQPDLVTLITQNLSPALMEELEQGTLDVAVITAPAKLSNRLKVVHHFEDSFVMIAPESYPSPTSKAARDIAKFTQNLPWILLHEETETGRLLRRWMKSKNFTIEPSMQADNFDLIVNLVALGLGVSFVPHRALALYSRKNRIRRIPMSERFSRQLSVVVRRHKALSNSVQMFVDGILF